MTEPRNYFVELADAVEELTKPRKPETKYMWNGLSKRGNPQQERRSHKTDLPSLLDSLAEALEPASDGELLLTGGFESQPSADMGAIFTAARIQSEVLEWAAILEVDVKKPVAVAKLLPLFVSAVSGGGQVRDLCNDALGWVRQARLATGYDDPYLPDVPCPICSKKHVMTADLDAKDGQSRKVHCRACKTNWDETNIGILAQMIEANQTRTTMAEDGPCVVDPECEKRGKHRHSWEGDGHTDKKHSNWPDLDDPRWGIYPVDTRRAETA